MNSLPDISSASRNAIAAMTDSDLILTARSLAKVAHHAWQRNLPDALRVCGLLGNIIECEAISRGIELEKVA